jgi:hypothetical protein
VVVMEACYSANYWGRTIQKLGHDVRLPPRQNGLFWTNLKVLISKKLH